MIKRIKTVFHNIQKIVLERILTASQRVEDAARKQHMEYKDVSKKLSMAERNIKRTENTIKLLDQLKQKKEQLTQKQEQLRLKKEQAEKLKSEAKLKKLELKALAQENVRIKLEEQKSRKSKKENLKRWQDNVFLRGRAAWNDMYGSVIERNRKYFAVSILLAVALIIAVIGLIDIGSQSKIQPFIVQVGQNGDIVDVSSAEHAPDITEKIIKYFLQRFVIAMHSVSGDNIVQKKMLAFVYASVNTSNNANALNILKSFIQNSNPFMINNQCTNQVNISSIYPVSHNTYQIAWEEIRRTIDGRLLARTYYTGQYTYKLAPSSGENFTYNPFGIYVTNMTWSEVQTEATTKS